jgi:hypothetical protein
VYQYGVYSEGIFCIRYPPSFSLRIKDQDLSNKFSRLDEIANLQLIALDEIGKRFAL